MLYHAGEKNLGTDLANISPDHKVRRAGVRRVASQIAKKAMTGAAAVAVTVGAANLAAGALDQQSAQQEQQSKEVTDFLNEQEAQLEVQNFVATHPGASEEDINAHLFGVNHNR